MAKLEPKAIIFDMDGVIVDSMPYHFIAWYEALIKLGVRVSCFDVFANEGERWDKTLKRFLMREKITPTNALLNEIFLNRQKIFKKVFRRFIFKGVKEFLFMLKSKKYKLALVTGTPRLEVERILPVEIKNIFDFIVAGDSVKRGKPHPEPYLTAAKGLKLKPGECVVVENAPYGIESAKKAGMYCVAVATSLPEEYLQKADLIVSRLEQIPKYIK